MSLTPSDKLRCLRGPEHTCGYLPGRQARNLYFLPDPHTGTHMHGELGRHGFRRSGNLLYRPDCEGCRQCIPVRVPVADFRPRRWQRRIRKRNQDVVARQVNNAFEPRHFRLYRRYVAARHAGGSMDSDDAEQYRDFIHSHWASTEFWEFHADGQLLAMAIIDLPGDGLSAMYTFFEPEAAQRSPGTFVILWQIEEARRRGLDWLYLGYWIRENRKMAYKGDFRPLQIYRGGHWLTLE